MTQTPGRHPSSACFIVPPHILREIARRGDPDQRRRARRSLAASERLRARRRLLAPAPAAPPETGRRRLVCDAGRGSDLPGRPVRSEADPPARDRAVNEAFDGMGETWSLYRQVFGRESVDGRGMRMDATVHFERDFANAFWDGSRVVFGDGDGRLFGPFTRALEVIGHELSHGMIQHEAAFEYEGEPGALCESFADVFGSLVRQRALGQTAEQADWLVGAGLLRAGVRGRAIRSMQHPGTAYDDPVLGKDPQPDHMSGYVHVEWDDGGVHINSGIPNRAFCLAALSLGGYAWEKAGRVWYLALTDRLARRSGFRQAAGLTDRIAAELYGAGSHERGAIRDAWARVGIPIAAADSEPTAA